MSEIPKRAFSTKEAAEYTGMSASTLEKWRLGGKLVHGPRWIKFGSRVVYLRDDLDSWIDSCRSEVT